MLQQEVVETCAAWVKKSTRSHHQTAEAVMMPLIDQANEPVRYGALLQMQYGFYYPLEQLLVPPVHALPLPDPFFHRSLLIKKDLEVMGMEPGLLSPYLPLVDDKFSILGALYVLEGAALGGRIIARMLGAHASLPAEAFSFFKGREEATGPHWTRFTQFLNEQATAPVQMQAVSDAAQATFAAYTRWIQTFKPL